MSDEENVEENTPPQPDMPVSPDEDVLGDQPEQEPQEVSDARQKMVDQVEQGKTPYVYESDVATVGGGPGDRPPERPASSLTNIVALLAFILIIGVGWFGWVFVQDISSDVKTLNQKINDASKRIDQQREKRRKADNAVVRSELKKAAITLETLVASENLDVATKAKELLAETNLILESLGAKSNTPAETRLDEPIEAPKEIVEDKPDAIELLIEKAEKEKVLDEKPIHQIEDRKAPVVAPLVKETPKKSAPVKNKKAVVKPKKSVAPKVAPEAPKSAPVKSKKAVVKPKKSVAPKVAPEAPKVAPVKSKKAVVKPKKSVAPKVAPEAPKVAPVKSKAAPVAKKPVVEPNKASEVKKVIIKSVVEPAPKSVEKIKDKPAEVKPLVKPLEEKETIPAASEVLPVHEGGFSTPKIGEEKIDDDKKGASSREKPLKGNVSPFDIKIEPLKLNKFAE